MEKNENGYPRVGNGVLGTTTPRTGTGSGGNATHWNGTQQNGTQQNGTQQNGTQQNGNGSVHRGGGCRGEDVGGAMDNNNGMNSTGSSSGNGVNHSCGGDGTCLDDMPLAYVYAPSQKFRLLYSAKDALAHGTLFEELYKPTEVYGRE